MCDIISLTLLPPFNLFLVIVTQLQISLKVIAEPDCLSFQNFKIDSNHMRPRPTHYKFYFVDSDCQVKQWLPPDDNTEVRRCRYDTEERTISKCPDEYEDWTISKLCESGTTSFVYEGAQLNQLVTAMYELFHNSQSVTYPFGSIVQNRQGRKFRNSFCASCNSAAWLGCRLKKSFDGDNNETISSYIQHFSSVRPYMFKFSIDLNRRSCTFDSDGYITQPNPVTGLDMCNRVDDHLKSCTCDFAFDFSTQTCRQLTYSDDFECSKENFVHARHSVSSYSKQICGFDDFSLLGSCHNSSRSAGMALYDSQTMLPVDPCSNTTQNTLLCHPPNNKTGCLEYFSMMAFSSAMGALPRSPKIALLNAVAVSYESVSYVFHLKQVEDKVVVGLELLFGLFSENESATCSKFSKINDTFSSFVVCPNQSLVNKETGAVYGDFILRPDEVHVCIEYVKVVFKLEDYHYVLCSLSIGCIIIYISCYISSADKSLTGNFFACQLTTLIAALLCYCFITEAQSVPAVCKLVASLVQYLFLSVHSWTNVLAIWMFRGLSAMKLVRRSGKKMFLMYAAYAWLSPLPFIALSYILDAYPVNGLYPVFSESFCFLANGWIRVLLFTGPIYLQIVIDIALCIWASVLIIRSGAGLSSNRSKEQLKKKIISVVKLIVIFGLQWFLLFFTEINSPYVKHLWTVLNVMVTLQGVLIILAQVLNQKNIARISTLRATSTKSNVTVTSNNIRYSLTPTHETYKL